MDLVTIGRKFHEGYQLKLKYLNHKAFSQNPNILERYKVILIETGSAIAQINQTRYVVTAPCMFCLNESENISFSESSNLLIKAVCFHPEVINKVFDFTNIYREPNEFSQMDYHDTYLLRVFMLRSSAYLGLLDLGPLSLKRITSIFDLISLELEKQRDSDWPCRSRTYLFELLIILQRVFIEGQPINYKIISEKHPEIEEVLLYLHTHYMDKISVSELSKKFNMNRTTLSNQFTEVTGFSIISYLNKLRIDLASIILRDSLLPISEITERVGFNDRTHFCRLFNSYTGYTPSAYRKKNCWLSH